MSHQHQTTVLEPHKTKDAKDTNVAVKIIVIAEGEDRDAVIQVHREKLAAVKALHSPTLNGLPNVVHGPQGSLEILAPTQQFYDSLGPSNTYVGFDRDTGSKKFWLNNGEVAITSREVAEKLQDARMRAYAAYIRNK